MVAGAGQFNEADNSLVAREHHSQLISFDPNVTDGRPDHRPTLLDRGRDPDGNVNYYRKVFLNEPAARNWRKKIGDAIATFRNLDKRKEWHLASWPKDYELYVQCKGHWSNPRQDLYLFGGPDRFRSANEFIPHARWLLDGAPEEPKCACKYCGQQKRQRLINASVGLPGALNALERERDRRGRSDVRSSGSPDRNHRMSRSRPSRAVAIRAEPPQEAAQVNERLEPEVTSKRAFRIGEIVWCRIHPPLVPSVSTSSAALEICWWPAFIQETRFKTMIQHHPEYGKQTSQVFTYRVLMLGTTASYAVFEEQLLPYRAYNPPDLQTVFPRLTIMPSDVIHGTRFQPLPDPLKISQPLSTDENPNPPLARTFENALVPYLVAVNTAQYISTNWCLTDHWDFESAPPDRIKQDRFQGLWWGPERIWLGDLVRLKSVRKNLVGELRPPERGAEDRGVLMKVNAFYLSPDESGAVTEFKSMVSGALYEVVEDVGDPPDEPVWPPDGSHNAIRDPSYLPLPPPPPGLAFRSITPSFDFDAHVELHQVAGRYYGSLLSAPLLPLAVGVATLKPINNNLLPNYPEKILSLAALTPGWLNSIEMQEWKPGRVAMLQDGHREALAGLGVPFETPAATPIEQGSQSSSFDSLFDERSDDDDVTMAG